jgi:hypothetical protein
MVESLDEGGEPTLPLAAKRDAPGALTYLRAASNRLTTSLTLSSAERRRFTVTDRRVTIDARE